MSATKLAVAHEFDYSTGRMTVLSTFGTDAAAAAEDYAEKINDAVRLPARRDLRTAPCVGGRRRCLCHLG